MLKSSVIISLVLLCFSGSISSATIWHWQDRFDKAEQQKLKKWVNLTVEGIESLVGPYPFDLHIHFYRRSGAGEPVPWANTKRSEIQGVDFHVDPSYSLQSFLDDWTGPHEISHLIIPYVGRRYSWFAEGFASYMQYQVMQKMGILTAEDVKEKYRWHIERADRRYRFDDLPFASAARQLRARREYATMYWGGAVYFLQVDAALQKQHSSLIQVLTKYLKCCRDQDLNLTQLVAELDRVSDSTIFADTLAIIKNKKGFPQHSGLH